MKRTNLCLSLILAGPALLWASLAFAMPSDADLNTYQMKCLVDSGCPFAVGAGAVGDFVLDRNLEESEDLEASWYGATIQFDPVSQAHLSLFLGVAEFDLGTIRINPASATTTRTVLKTDTDFAVGGSGKVDIISFPVVPNQPNMWLFGSGGYRFSNPDVESVRRGTVDASSFSMEVEVSEWQAALGLSQRWDNLLGDLDFITTAGVQYSDLEVDITGTSAFTQPGATTQSVLTGTRESDEVVGVFAGLQLMLPGDQWSVAVEGRFVAETAVSVQGRLRW